jgi:hypothetical protein
MDLAGQVMARPEYRDAPRVFVIVDNGSDHCGRAAIERLRAAHPNAVMIHTPVHASWLNQIEIFFSRHPEESRLAERLHKPGAAIRNPARLRGPL